MPKTTPKHSKTIAKRVSTLFVVVLMCFALALPCFAWTRPPNYQDINGTGYNLQQLGYGVGFGGVAWVFIEYRVPNGQGGFNFEYTYFVDPVAVSSYIQDLDPNEEPTPQGFYNLTRAEGTIWSQSSLLYPKIQEAIDTYDDGYQNGYNVGHQNGFEDGFEEGKELSYNQGYTDGTKESDVAQNYLLTLFSAPAYILSTIFSFEILGLNVYTLIAFLVTLAVIGFVLKKLL